MTSALSLLLVLLLAAPAHLTPSGLQVRSQRTPRDLKQDPIKVLISDCATQGDSSDVSQEGREIDLSPGSPLVLTHKIKLVPSGSDSGSGSCGCEMDFAALRERLERLEREVSALREKCGGADGGCCTSKESKGAGCFIKPETAGCPNECSDQGRCVDGKCVCFPGFGGPDCSQSDCPGNCNSRGRCVNGQCVCDPGYSGPDCSQRSCPDDCNSRGRCVYGRCVCDSGFAGPSCSDESCPGNCNSRGRCVDGRCVCNPGFTGPDCSKRACPNNCNNRGRCVNGKCVCDSGFAGADCSGNDCPGNCNNRGRCVNGECVCDDGFGGPDCSEKTCPNDCFNRGRCIDGTCVCDSGFTGDDCSESSCPGNCNNRGRCVSGQCVCNEGFTSADCSEKACPNNCNNRGKCVNGKCVCDVGFAGPDCAAKGCPKNCNNKGRCVKGRCVCRQGFTGPDCSQCEEGMTGPNCDTVMAGVSQLTARDVTETSVTLVWTPPPIQYDTYHITFTSQKESDHQITGQVEGRLTTFTQTGLAAGQEYTVTISGEIDGQRGAESSAEFTTLISGPSKLQVVKTTTTSAVVQWEQSQGEIDHYHLTVTPTGGAGTTQEMTVPADQNSAHIQQLEPGRLYDIILVAEKGAGRSEPAATQVTPGKTQPLATIPAFTMQVTLAPGKDGSNRSQESEPSPEVQGFKQQERRDRGKEAGSVKVGGIKGPEEDSVIARNRPLVSRKITQHGTRPKLAEKPSLFKKPNERSPLHLNTTRLKPGARKVGPGALRKPQVLKKPKPVSENRTMALTLKDPRVEALSSQRSDATNPAVKSGSHLEGNRQGSPTESTTAVGSSEQTGAGMSASRNDSGSEPSGGNQKQEKKCMNKIKVTHIRLPHKDRGSGKLRSDGAVLVQKKPSSHHTSSDTGGTSDSSAESDNDYSTDPFNKLLTDTFNNLNITTFSVGLSQPSDLSADSQGDGEQVLDGPRQSASTSHSSTALSSSTPSPISPSATPTHLVSSSPTSPSPSSSTLSSEGNSSTAESKKPDINISKGSAEDKKPPPSGKAGILFRRTPAKSGFMRRPRPNFGLPQNRSHLNFGGPHHSPHLSNLIPGTPTKGTSMSKLLTSPSLPASDESSSFEATVQASDLSEYNSGPTAQGLSEVKQNETKVPTETGRIPARRPPLKRGYLRRPIPNVGPPQNNTHPYMRRLPGHFTPLHPASDRSDRQLSSTDVPVTSSPSEESSRSGSTSSGEEEHEDIKTNVSAGLRQTIRRVTSSHDTATKVGYFRRAPLFGVRFQNKTNTNLKPPQHPHGGYTRKPFPFRRPNGSAVFPLRNQTSHLEEVSTPETQANQLEKQTAPTLTQRVQNRQSEEQHTAGVVPGTPREDHDSSIRPQMELEREDHIPVQTNEPGKDITRMPDLDSDIDIQKERVEAGRNTDGQSRPLTRQTFPSAKQGAPRPVRLPVRLPPTRKTLINQYISKNPRRQDTKMNKTAKSLFDSKTETPREAASKPLAGSSSGVTREILENVAVTNRTSKGFTLTWDSPEGKYKNFVVTRKKAEKDKGPKQRGGQKGQKEEQEGNGPSAKEPDFGSRDDENRLPESVPRISGSATEGDKPIQRVLAGSARSFQFDNLPPQTEYTVTLLGKGPGLLSRLHKLVISTGPEPPKDIVFSEVTENSLTVSWTKPKSPISGFKVTYTHKEEGEPVSVSVDSNDSTLGLSQLSPGSTYEISVISVLGLDESDPIGDSVMTLPDAPTDLRAINVTDTTALLLWRPALAAVDKYAIVYGSGTDSELRVTVSGNAAEQQLSGLDGFTTYTVTVTGLLGSQESSPATTTFTTTRGPAGDGDGLRDLQASDVTPRTALLSWKPPSNPAGSYKLTYQTEGYGKKEVMLDATVTEYSLSRLYPGSVYTVELQAEDGNGGYSTVASTDFTTGTLRFPFPTDCSQELLNGIRTSGEVDIFPQGKLGAPVMVYCDMETDGGGWTVFQRRKDGSVDFFRGWKDYVKGFGDLSGEFWLGLEVLHNLTAMTKMSLRVDLRDEDESVFAKYSTFEVAKRNYKLTVGGYSGTAGDSLSYHNNRFFSTKDRDPAPFITRCAMSYRGGWWYKNCHEANLNGLYGINVNHQGVIWTSWKGKEFSVPFAEMKMRPAAFSPPPRE